MHKLEELKIWQNSIELATSIYKTTSQFPKEELYGLVSQMRRCAVSISSNIAEGAGRNSEKEFIHFLSISRGSLLELKTQLIISERLNFITTQTLNEYDKSIEEILKMMFVFKKNNLL